MDLSHKKWPNRWDYHISQYCNFYFCDKDIKYLDRDFWAGSRTNESKAAMNLSFQIGDHNYMVSIHHGEGTHFSCSIYYKKTYENGEGPTDLFVTAAITQYIYVLDDIAGIGGHDMSVSDIMEFAEGIMWEDFNRREGNDWDNDNDDNGENDPIEPFSPTQIVEPELTLI